VTDKTKTFAPTPRQGDSLSVARGVRGDIVQAALAITHKSLPSAVSARLSADRASERAERRTVRTLHGEAPTVAHPSASGPDCCPAPPLSKPVRVIRCRPVVERRIPAAPGRGARPAQNPSRPFRGFTGPGAPAALRVSEAPAPKRNKRSRTRRNRPGKRQRQNGARS
jgi:hypothetical protein